MKEVDVIIIKKVCVKTECWNCGEPATKRITYLYENARRNPSSNGYGKDDISWCEDDVRFACEECEDIVRKRAVPPGMEWCSTYTKNERFEHLFLIWHETTEETKS